MAEHKHAAVLRAIADKGFEAAQYLAREANRDVWIQSSYACNPLTHPHFEWRIKPEPKPDVVTYHSAYPSIGYETIEAANKHAVHPDRKGVYRLIYDGETRKLKSAEVLP